MGLEKLGGEGTKCVYLYVEIARSDMWLIF